MHDGEPLTFKASFEVLPEIQVEGYKDLRADKPEITVTDEEVEAALNNVREQGATYTSVEGRTLAEGDFAQASMRANQKKGTVSPKMRRTPKMPPRIPCIWMRC